MGEFEIELRPPQLGLGGLDRARRRALLLDRLVERLDRAILTLGQRRRAHLLTAGEFKPRLGLR